MVLDPHSSVAKLIRSLGGNIASGEEAVNLRPAPNRGQGNCFYHSTAPSIPGATDGFLRTNIVEHILRHKDDKISEDHTFRSAIAMLAGKSTTPEYYCVWQGKTGQFSSVIEVAAFCREHKKYVQVYRKSPGRSKYLLLWTMGNSSIPQFPFTILMTILRKWWNRTMMQDEQKFLDIVTTSQNRPMTVRVRPVGRKFRRL